MKEILILLLVPFFCFSQSDKNISVISVEKMNVVYRSIENPIKIAVPGAKSFKATAGDAAMVKVDSVGNYNLLASGSEMKIDIEAIMEDGSVLHEEKTFRVKGIPAYTGVLNENSHGSCRMTTDELSKAQINVILEGVLSYEPNIDFGVKEFNIKLIKKRGKSKPTVVVEGNRMNSEIIGEIKKLKPGSMVIISEIKTWNHTPIPVCKNPSPIVIEIYEE